MDYGSIVGYAVGAACIVAAAVQWEAGTFFDAAGMVIVLGGILASLLISQSAEALAGMIGNWRLILKRDRSNSADLIRQLLEFSTIARRDGILALEARVEKLEDPFMKQGLLLAIDGTDPEILKDILYTEMENTSRRHAEAKRPWDKFRDTALAWGVLGAVFGIVVVLREGLGDPDQLVKGLAAALYALLYGLFIALFLVGPLCDKLELRNSEEMFRKHIILKGVLAIQDGDNPRAVASKLNTFLLPSERASRDTAIVGTHGGKDDAGGDVAGERG